ncbi:hypothetical protein T484DRAFT_1782152 [Baffinella frigidus]|nr:hypothetical protein T484DRAFT_1782152 [Cryptophyta sp. CCMP2293]
MQLTARRPVPETICSFARLNADISQGRYSNEVELLVRTQLQEGRYLYRQVQECPANKVLVVRYTDLVRDLPGTLRRVADVLQI